MKTHQLFLAFLLIFQTGFGQIFSKLDSGEIVNSPTNMRGCNIIDFNHDGFQDIFFTQNGLNALYQNLGNWEFQKVTTSPFGGSKVSSGSSWADYDNDGFVDLFIANDGNNQMISNQGLGNFTEITNQINVNNGGLSWSAAWADLNADGLVDLFVNNGNSPNVNFLYHNQGGGSFNRVTTGAIVTDQLDSRAAVFCDFDNDNDQDLYVANGHSTNGYHNAFYINDGNGSLTRQLNSTIVNDALKSQSASWGDFDNDGDMDLFICNVLGNNQLFSNDGDSTFTEIVTGAIVNDSSNSLGSTWGDFNNDGWLDLFVGNGMLGDPVLNLLYINIGDGTFSLDTTGPQMTDSAVTRGVASGDLNNDGFLDIVTATREGVFDRIYKNNGNSFNWVNFQCTGILSNQSAIGVKLRLKATGAQNLNWQMREISSQTGHRSQNMLNVHFGLGEAVMIDSLIAEWPSGQVCVLTDIPANQFYELDEGCQISLVASCPKPDDIWVTNLTHNSARLNWSSVSQAHHYEIKGRPVQSSSYTTLIVPNGAPNYKNVLGLALNQTFVWTIRAVCDPAGTDVSGWSALDTFRTHCFRPDSIWVSPVASTGVQLNWSPIANAQGYEIKGRRLGVAIWTTISAAGGSNSKSVFGLVAGTSYEWTIRTICQSPNVISDFVPIDTFSTTNSNRLAQTEKSPKLGIYPNPANDVILIEMPELIEGSVSVSINSIDGRLVYFNYNLQVNKLNVDVSDWGKGVYIVKVNSDVTYRGKLVVR